MEAKRKQPTGQELETQIPRLPGTKNKAQRTRNSPCLKVSGAAAAQPSGPAVDKPESVKNRIPFMFVRFA
jgi:hypothetical protein